VVPPVSRVRWQLEAALGIGDDDDHPLRQRIKHVVSRELPFGGVERFVREFGQQHETLACRQGVIRILAVAAEGPEQIACLIDRERSSR
jgi:hypothetical protein